jgi:hypothetical protein
MSRTTTDPKAACHKRWRSARPLGGRMRTIVYGNLGEEVRRDARYRPQSRDTHLQRRAVKAAALPAERLLLAGRPAVETLADHSAGARAIRMAAAEANAERIGDPYLGSHRCAVRRNRDASVEVF